MNIIPGQLHTPGAGSAPAGSQPQPHADQSRARQGATAPPTGAPRESVPDPATTRHVLDLSDTTLTRRDLPRGSLVDIVA